MAWKTLRKVLAGIALALLLFIVFQPAYLFQKSGYKAPDSTPSRCLDTSYTVYEDGLAVSYSLPFQSFYFNNGDYSVSFPLGKVRAGDALAFQTKGCGIRVLVDGKEIYSYVYPAARSYPSVRMYHSVSLDESYSYSTVTVEYVKGRNNPVILSISPPIIGNTSSNYHYFFDPYEWPAILLISMFFLGLLLLVLSFLLHGYRRRSFLLFSLLVIDITLTSFFESLISQLLVGNPLFSTFVVIFLRTLTPYLFLLLLRCNFADVKAFKPNSLLSVLAVSNMLLFPLFSLLSMFSFADFNMIYLLLEPLTILFLSVAVTAISKLKGQKAYTYLAVIILFLVKNFVRIVLVSFTQEGIIFDVLNIILSSSAFIICIFDALRRYTEENEMVVNINTLVKRSHIDTLSGLKNVNSFKLYLDRIKDECGSYYVMFFDLDGLKSVNDSQGHLKGDELIRDLGAAIRNVVGVKADAFRIGGDEFIVSLATTEERPDILYDIIRAYESMDMSYSVSGCGDILNSFSKDDLKAFFDKLDKAVLMIKRGKNERR